MRSLAAGVCDDSMLLGHTWDGALLSFPIVTLVVHAP